MKKEKKLTEKIAELKEGDFVLVGTNVGGRLFYTVGKVINSDNVKRRSGSDGTVGLEDSRSVAYSSYRGSEYPTFMSKGSRYHLSQSSITEVVVGLERIVNHLQNHPSERYGWHAEVLKRAKK